MSHREGNPDSDLVGILWIWLVLEPLDLCGSAHVDEHLLVCLERSSLDHKPGLGDYLQAPRLVAPSEALELPSGQPWGRGGNVLENQARRRGFRQEEGGLGEVEEWRGRVVWRGVCGDGKGT